MKFELSDNYANYIEVGVIESDSVCVRVTDRSTGKYITSFLEPCKAKLLASALMAVAHSIEAGES